jgi:hypothetical protein
LWNWYAPALWNRFVVEPVRVLAASVGLSEREFRELVRVAYVKAAEFQARGLVHFHAIIRLDDPEDRGLPPGVTITANELAAAIRQAGRRALFNGDVGGATGEMRFGEQLHARVVQDGADDDARDPGQVAAYVAKYSRKGSHEQIMGRGASAEQLRERRARAARADGDGGDPCVRAGRPGCCRAVDAHAWISRSLRDQVAVLYDFR